MGVRTTSPTSPFAPSRHPSARAAVAALSPGDNHAHTAKAFFN